MCSDYNQQNIKYKLFHITINKNIYYDKQDMHAVESPRFTKEIKGGGIREYFLIKKEVFFVKQDLRGDGPQSL